MSAFYVAKLDILLIYAGSCESPAQVSKKKEEE